MKLGLPGWEKVLSAAPGIADAARMLLQRVSGPPAAPQTAAAPQALTPEQLSAIDVRLGPLQQRMSALEQESRASFDVVRSMADQHTHVVGAVDALLAGTRRLQTIAAALGVAVLVLAVLLAMRW